jgi:hypothetical protein
MFQRISTVTYCVADPEQSCAALSRFMGYEVLSEAPIPEALAIAWGTPKLAGRDCRILRPASGHPSHVRFIAAAPTPGYAPLKTYGWNAAELHVRDVQALAGTLQHSAYTILGGPRDLMNNGAVIALQVQGPGDEVFYLTQISGIQMQESYGKANCDVDRLFIAVLGARDFPGTLEFYRSLCKGVNKARKFAIRVLSAAHGLDPFATRYNIAGAIMEERYRIEIDGYPDSATERPVTDGELPPGLAMISIELPSLDDVPCPLDIHRQPGGASYGGDRLAILKGPSGEWMELLETGAL